MKRLSPLFLFVLLVFVSCKKFMYHPDEVRPVEKNLNARNIQRINAMPSQDAFKFILIGDTQRFYEELDAFVAHANGLDDISFILLNGDLVDFGLNNEYNWIAEKLEKLKVPYVTAIGNHDMLANGRLIFRKMFGPENFSFTYSGSKFIAINTNSREVNFDGSIPDLPWLQTQLDDSDEERNIFILSHVPPYSADFDSTLERPFTRMLAAEAKTRISLHGHEHRYELSEYYNDGVTYLLAASGEDRNYALVEVNGSEYTITKKEY